MDDEKEYPAVDRLIAHCNALFPDNRRTTADLIHVMKDVAGCSDSLIAEVLPFRPADEISYDPPIGQAGERYINAIISHDDDDLKGPSL